MIGKHFAKPDTTICPRCHRGRLVIARKNDEFVLECSNENCDAKATRK